MPVTDPIADLLTRMRNAQHARQTTCRCGWSRHTQDICEVLRKEGYLSAVLVEGSGKEKTLVVEFLTSKPPLTLRRVSKPGRRIYVSRQELKPVLSGFGIAVVSTSDGVMTDREARKRNFGGELLCTVS